MPVAFAKTRDGQWRVFMYADQTAEVANYRGTILIGRLPFYEIARRLLELGVDTNDLLPA